MPTAGARIIFAVFAKIPPPIPPLAVHSQDHRPIFALPTPYLGRFMFGFRNEIRT